MEHIPLIELHAGLVEGIHAQHMGRNAARQLEEIEQLAQRIGIDLVGLQDHDGDTAVHVCGQRALERLLLYEVQRLAL